MGIPSLLGFGASWNWGQSPLPCLAALRAVGKHCILHVPLGVGGVEEEASPDANVQSVALHLTLRTAPHRGQGCASLSSVFLGASQISLGLNRSWTCRFDIPGAFVGCAGALGAPSPPSQAGLWSSTGLCHCRCESLCVFPCYWCLSALGQTI